MQSGERIVINGRDYRLGSVLSTSAGSYGQVWAATDSAGRAVALKFINTEAMFQTDTSLHGHWRAHLEREIAFLAGLTAAESRHVVTLLDHGQVDDRPVLVMERLQANLGQWLTQQRRDGASPPDLACILDWAAQILAGLDVIHRAGFVYRDLKFSNILVGDRGTLLKLADFGTLKREDGDSTRSFMGTPATMAPEQILPIRQDADGCEYAVDYRTDFYALGLLLFALLTEQATTSAQRRLGQLLALHGQEGAGQYRDQLGGLTSDEQELLRRSVEFWTVPVRPEREQGGTALLLTDLLARLLARDPAARPASSTAIRAVLDVVRTDQPTASPIAPDALAPPLDTPPNRHPRHVGSPAGSPWLRRTVNVAGALGLAGALTWAAIIRPALHQNHTEPLSAALVPSPPASPTVSSTPTAEPAAESAASASSTPKVVAKPSIPEPATLAEPPRVENAIADITTELPAENKHESIAEPSAEAMNESTFETKAAPTAENASSTAPVAEPVAESGTESAIGVHEPTVPPSEIEPVASSPEPTTPTVGGTSRKSSIPAVGEQSAPVRAARKSTRGKAIKAAPPPVESVEKNVRVTPPLTEPVTVPPPAVPPKAPPIAKPVPKPPVPAMPAVARHTPSPANTPSTPRISRESVPVTRVPAMPKVATLPTSTSRTTHPAPRSSVLPPIELVSNANNAKATSSSTQPPIELIGHSGSTKAAPSSTQPPIELVSRSSPVPITAPARSAPPTTTAAPRQSSVAPPSQPPTRSTDPITAFQKNAGRAAKDIRRETESFANWAGRTGAMVGTEIQRGLDSANRAVNTWTGNCAQANGCQQARRVERRDRWSRRHDEETTSRYQQPAPYDDEMPDEPPPRRPQEYR